MSYEPPISVSGHAAERAWERWRIERPEQLVVEVLEAIRERRFSPTKPPGVENREEPDCLYAWTPDGRRVYVLTVNTRTGGSDFAIKTVLKVDP